VTTSWDDRAVLAQRDTAGATVEEQLPALIRTLETGEAEAKWARTEEQRRAGIRQARWEPVRQEALAKLAYDRNTQRLADELARRDAAAAMTAHAADLDPAQAKAALGWASWIRRHAEATHPLNGPLHILEVPTWSHEELQPHMNGWSTRRPYRR
jgi:hypothetical protein